MKCISCDSDRLVPAWKFQETQILRCKNCDLEFSKNMEGMDSSEYQEMDNYKKMYSEMKQGKFHPGYTAIIAYMKKAVNKYIKKQNARIVDLGCGSGYLLSHLKQEGRFCLALDFNPQMTKIASELFGLDTLLGGIDELLEKGHSFDFVMSSHVLEHIDTPREFLEKARNVLNPGGVFLVIVPNRSNIRYRDKLVKGKHPKDHYPPHHVSFWSMKALKNACKNAGYEILSYQTQTYPDKYTVEDSLQKRYGIKNKILSKIFANIFGILGKLFGIQGSNLFIVIRGIES